MLQIISDHNIPVKIKKRKKKIEGEDKEIKIDFSLYLYQSEPTITILDIPESNLEIKNLENELKESLINIFNKYKEKIEKEK